MRLKFKKGKQREFIKKVLDNTFCPSLRELVNRGININYSSLKNYYSERRMLPESLFNLLCQMASLGKNSFSFEKISENSGQVKGGKISRKI